ncbi:MAG: ribbon-helix-helix protein, CopG family [Actinomycetota bacterium]|jgi:metal-responsive CopG/Arc/MetJ family transcriptional regulator|nr:ribbon-helix-helix protein, CopG family [Actinomycetota bacterium]MDP9477989.1 ribbon-helix-helix protein, CopG family [Actinomycetota bacterium]
MSGRKTEILSFSVPPEIKRGFKELAEEQGMGASELFREMIRVYEDYREEREFRRLQRRGAMQTLERFGSEEELFDYLYSDR